MSQKDTSDRDLNIGLSSGVAGGVAGFMGAQKFAQTNMYQTSRLGQALSSASTNVSSKIAESTLGQVAKKVSSSAASASEAIGKRATGGLVSILGERAGTAAAKAGSKLAGEALGVGIDAIMGAVNMSNLAAADVPDDIKGYNMTMEVVSTTVNIAANFLTGPLALALMAAQLVGAILDAAWNPFQSHFNSDLETIRKSIHTALKKAYNEQNVNWPLEVKPDFMSGLNSESTNYSETMEEFKKYMDEYYSNNGIITKEAALEEENVLLEIIEMRRMRRVGKFDENGNLVVADPTAAAVSMLDNDNNNMLMLLALAIAVRRQKLRLPPKPSRVRQYWEANKTSVIISGISLLVFFFCCISIVFTTTAAVSS